VALGVVLLVVVVMAVMAVPRPVSVVVVGSWDQTPQHVLWTSRGRVTRFSALLSRHRLIRDGDRHRHDAVAWERTRAVVIAVFGRTRVGMALAPRACDVRCGMWDV
jgi:hypothetical protein